MLEAQAAAEFDHEFLDKLPATVDPCGENGEFHTCVLAGPMFREPIPARIGETVEREGFWFADLVPGADQRVRPKIRKNGIR